MKIPYTAKINSMDLNSFFEETKEDEEEKKLLI